MRKIDFEPETVDQMRERYPACLQFIYDIDHLKKGSIAPEEVRANVFDFDSGLRFVVAVILEREEKTYRVSAIMQDGSPVYGEMRSFLSRRLDGRKPNREQTIAAMMEVYERILKRLEPVAGDDVRGLQFFRMSEKFVPHWRRPFKVGQS